MRIKIILCLPIIIGLINGQNPCDDAIYIYLKGQNIENLKEKDIQMLKRFENECSEYESSLKEKQKQKKEKQKQKKESLKEVTKYSGLKYDDNKYHYFFINLENFNKHLIDNYNINFIRELNFSYVHKFLYF